MAFYLLAASPGLAALAVVLAIVGARTPVTALSLGASLGLGFATNAMATGARRQWDRHAR